MNNKQQEIIKKLIDHGKDHLEKPKEFHHFSKFKEADDLNNDIENYPHFFVLGCVVDRQIKAERAWLIPYKVSQIIGSIEFEDFSKLSQEGIKNMFLDNNLHRFNNNIADCFYKAIQRIKEQYDGDASKIWADNPSSAGIVRRFLEFDGVGLKIATMAANILAREFKVKMSDYNSIDISTDIHIIRMFKKLGLVPESASKEYIVYRARELYPEYPGIFDLALFRISRGELDELWED